MNRLEQKCLIATVGFHLLLVLVLLFGSAFFSPRAKPDDTQVLDVIPANLIDAKFNSGVKSAPPPPPTPPVVQPPQPVVTPPTPEPPKPEPVKPPEPEPPKPEKISPEALEPVVKPKPVKPHEIKVDLTQVVHKVPKNTDATAAEERREAAKEARRRAAAFAAAARSIKDHSSSATTVELFGTSSVSYANYVSVVKSVYEQAWTPPDDTASDDANTRVSVTIGRDGSVITARILDPSGDASVDRSVQRTLDRVTFVAPFPDGAKEKERTFIINFNLKAKRMLG